MNHPWPGRIICLILALPLRAFAAQGAATPADPAAADAGAAVISGQVIDARTKAPIKDAWIGVANTEFQCNSDENGRFRIELPPGRYDLDVAFDLYQAQTLAGVVIEPGQSYTLPAPIRLRLESSRSTEVTV